MHLAATMILKNKPLSRISLKNMKQTAIVLLRAVLTSANYSAKRSRRVILTSSKFNEHVKVSHNFCKIRWAMEIKDMIYRIAQENSGQGRTKRD